MPYVVTPTGPLGFQVSAIGVATNGVIADFASQAEAEAFVAKMRQIDGGRSYTMTATKVKDLLAKAEEAETRALLTKRA